MRKIYITKGTKVGTVDNDPPSDQHLPPGVWPHRLRARDPGCGLVQGGDSGSQGQDQTHLWPQDGQMASRSSQRQGITKNNHHTVLTIVAIPNKPHLSVY